MVSIKPKVSRRVSDRVGGPLVYLASCSDRRPTVHFFPSTLQLPTYTFDMVYYDESLGVVLGGEAAEKVFDM